MRRLRRQGETSSGVRRGGLVLRRAYCVSGRVGSGCGARIMSNKANFGVFRAGKGGCAGKQSQSLRPRGPQLRISDFGFGIADWRRGFRGWIISDEANWGRREAGDRRLEGAAPEARRCSGHGPRGTGDDRIKQSQLSGGWGRFVGEMFVSVDVGGRTSYHVRSRN